MITRILLITLAAALSACAPLDDDISVDPNLKFAETRALAKSTLNKLQGPSIRENREYCAFIGISPEGELRVPETFKGTADSCGIAYPVEDGWTLTASIHTHAGYDPAYNSEFPSSADVESEREAGTHGYVSTPGGRFWFVNGETGVSTQLCGTGCLTQDPRFTESAGSVKTSYSYREIKDLEL